MQSNRKYLHAITGPERIGLSLVLLPVLLLVCAGCGFQTRGPASNAEEVEKIKNRTPTVAGIRQELKALTYHPRGAGFAYMATAPDPDLADWLAKNESTIRWALDQMPAGFALEIKGHSCATGDRPTNITLSQSRAYQVYRSMLAAGYPAAKIRYRGVAFDELLEGFAATDQKQRRVSLDLGLGR